MRWRAAASRPALPRATGLVLVATAYYLGAEIGFSLQSPNAPQSVLWLPNSILLGVLLEVPAASWPAYLAAAFPAQMLVAWQTGAPPATMALLFGTNCMDAALGAWLVRRLAGQRAPFRLNGLRDVCTFAVGATFATVLMSVADAGISVATAWSASYQAAFVTRVRSNTLTHLIVVPALIDLLAIDWRRMAPARVVEALTFMGALAGVCGWALSGSRGSAFPASLYLPLPLLLWAAVRLGPGGTGGGVLLVAIAASWNALHGRGPFAGRSPLEGVISLQLFLLASAVPLLCLAGVIRERNRAATELSDREAALRRSYLRVQELAGKLIAAQEEERARIARELHDDFNQQLAFLAISISTLRQASEADGGRLDASLGALHDQTVALTEQIRRVSHDLHPSLLNHVGLVPALKAHCAQFSEQQTLQVVFDAYGQLADVPRDTAVCLYRVAQEALRNVVTHAGVTDATVSISRMNGAVELTVTDRGRGFDPASAQRQGGLGLLSIRERARVLGGTVVVSSAPGGGTTIHVSIPVATTPVA